VTPLDGRGRSALRLVAPERRAAKDVRRIA
jgi:hypothetical protein